MPKKPFLFSKHFRRDKNIEASLAEDCIFTGKKFPETEPRKWKAVKPYKKGVLVVVFREYKNHYYVITSYWKKGG